MSNKIDIAYVKIRPDLEQEWPFILATYLNGNFYSGSYLRQEMPSGKKQYYKKAAEYILAIMALPNTRTDVAVLADDPSFIFGYMISNGRNLIWCHVKERYREKGIATALMRGKKITHYTNHTRAGQAIAKNKKFIFDPEAELT